MPPAPPSGPPPPSAPSRDSSSNPSSATKPSVFQMPSSTPIPPLHPYNKPPSAGTGGSATSTPGSTAHPTPNRPPSTGSLGSGNGGDLRPSYFSSTPSKEERDRSLNRAGIRRPASTTSTPAHSHTHTAAAPHHHHHHHHHHTHTTQPPTTTSTADRGTGFGASASATAETKPATPSTSTRYDYAPFDAAYEKFKQKRDFLDRQEADRRDAERKASSLPSIQTSPKATASSSMFPRAGLPPSPTDRRSLPTSTATTAPSSASKPSISPQAAPATIGAGRTIPPISSYSSLSRALPSPFDSSRDRIGTAASKTEAAHHRSLSNSGNRPADPLPSGLSQASPPKAAAQVPASNRGGFGVPLFAPSVQRSPVNRPTSNASTQDAARDAARPASTATASSQQPAKPQTAPYSGFGGTGTGYYNPSSYYRPGFSYGERAERERADKQRFEMERLAEAEREREAKRKASRNEAPSRDDHLRTWERGGERERQEKERQAQSQGGAFSAPRFDPWTGKEKKPYAATDNRAYKVEPPAAQYPPESTSAMQQVAPQREPRPYGYKAETTRDYTYSSRDKRSRMDMAVEEQAHRRGSVSKAKRRREEEKPKETTFSARDLAKLVTPNIVPPTITNHLIGRAENVVGTEVYEGSHWNIGKTATMKNNYEGLIRIQVSGRFLGPQWTSRGEVNFKDANPDELVPENIVDLQTRIWGTTTYTDDSDLVAMLIHDGWVKWIDDPLVRVSPSLRDDDMLIVTVMIVPPLIRYYGQKKFGIVSRGWGNGHDGMSITIKSLERVPVTKTTYSSKKARKMRLADLAKQRALVLADSIKTNVECAIILDNVEAKSGGKQRVLATPGYGYAPEFLLDLLDMQSPRNLYGYDLRFSSGPDVFHLSMLKPTNQGDQPTFVLKTKSDEAKDGELSAIHEGIMQDDMLWVQGGLVVLNRAEARKGTLYRADTFTWEKRETELYDDFEKAAVEEEEKPMEGIAAA